jgi:hypothetical protein
VAAGVGISLIAELGLSSVRDDIVVRSLGRETPVRRVYAALLDGGYRSPAHRGDAGRPARGRGALLDAPAGARTGGLTPCT